ncbi:hypothetical protein [Streptomyces sp. NBC_00588]|uniref:hypothetical protein n=1 Tax=Streptomyces sp. NBC_00588 TaxID=2975784 RepID=UPI002E800837|nr:hypothetical protein [Streptomyces sp. NBC_00588]WUB36686.1 hypothetical protein OHN38_17885 [Streptomyces sp. NBC_00588]
MTASRRWILVSAAVLMAVGCCGCSDGGTSSEGAGPAPSRTGASGSPSASAPSARPSPSPTSPFCLDLSYFQMAMIAYKSEVGGAMSGQPLDFPELRRKAGLVADAGERMRPSAPLDIADEFRTVLKAVATSASHLKEGGDARAVLDPVYGKRNSKAFDTVQNYDCGGTGTA